MNFPQIYDLKSCLGHHAENVESNLRVKVIDYGEKEQKTGGTSRVMLEVQDASMEGKPAYMQLWGSHTRLKFEKGDTLVVFNATIANDIKFGHTFQCYATSSTVIVARGDIWGQYAI